MINTLTWLMSAERDGGGGGFLSTHPATEIGSKFSASCEPGRRRAALAGLFAACLLLLGLAGCNHVQPHLKIPELRIAEPALRPPSSVTPARRS